MKLIAQMSKRQRLVADYEHNLIKRTDAFTPGVLPRRHPDLLFSRLVGDEGSYITPENRSFFLWRYLVYVVDQLYQWGAEDYLRYLAPPAWSVVVYVLNFKTSLSTAVFGLYTGVLLFLLVFRNQQAYGRWAEGRAYWGHLMGELITLNEIVNTWFQDYANCDGGPELREAVARYSIALIYSFKRLLRNEPLSGLELKGILPEEITDSIRKQCGLAPYYCIDALRNIILHAALQSSSGKKSNVGPRHDGSIEKVFKDLNSHMVEIVRVKNSLFPVSYGILLEFFAFVYLVAFPLALLETFGFWVIPSALCMGCVYNVLIDISQQLEDPFGYDAADLNLDVFCHTTETQIVSRFILGSVDHYSEYLKIADMYTQRRSLQLETGLSTPTHEVNAFLAENDATLENC